MTTVISLHNWVVCPRWGVILPQLWGKMIPFHDFQFSVIRIKLAIIYANLMHLYNMLQFSIKFTMFFREASSPILLNISTLIITTNMS